MGEPSDDSDPASLEDQAVVGERVENVDQVLAATGTFGPPI